MAADRGPEPHQTPNFNWRSIIFGLFFSSFAVALFLPIILFPKTVNEYLVGDVLSVFFGFQLGLIVPIMEGIFRELIREGSPKIALVLLLPLAIAYFGAGAWLGMMSKKKRFKSRLGVYGFGMAMFACTWLGFSLLGAVSWFFVCRSGAC